MRSDYLAVLALPNHGIYPFLISVAHVSPSVNEMVIPLGSVFKSRAQKPKGLDLGTRLPGSLHALAPNPPSRGQSTVLTRCLDKHPSPFTEHTLRQIGHPAFRALPVGVRTLRPEPAQNTTRFSVKGISVGTLLSRFNRHQKKLGISAMISRLREPNFPPSSWNGGNKATTHRRSPSQS